MGPIPEGAQLVWSQSGPDGEPWFSHRVDVPELIEEQGRSFVLQPTTSDIDLTSCGECAFTLRLVDELVGLDHLLHTGSFTVTERAPDDWAIGFDWLIPLGLIAFDVDADTDAPKLRGTVFLPADVDTYRVVALLFRGSDLVRRTSEVSTGWTFTSSKGNVVGVELRITFDDVRAWNNLRESGWGSEFFTLDTNPGDYEFRVAVDREVVRVTSFTIGADGRLETERIEPDERARPNAWFVADQRGSLPAADPAILVENAAYGGDLATAALVWNGTGLYWYIADRDGTPELDPGQEERARKLSELGESGAEMFQRWETDMADGLDTSIAEYQQEYYLSQCQAAIEAAGAWLAQRAAIDAPDDLEIEIRDEQVTVGAAAERAHTMVAQATATLEQAAARASRHADRLGRYRDVLHGDKLTIFEDRPIPEYEYLTTDKREITSPEDLAAAEYWYFEGVADIEHTAQVDGSTVEVRTRGWRVLGFRFDDTHSIVDRYENSGPGSHSPVTAYQQGVRADH